MARCHLSQARSKVPRTRYSLLWPQIVTLLHRNCSLERRLRRCPGHTSHQEGRRHHLRAVPGSCVLSQYAYQRYRNWMRRVRVASERDCPRADSSESTQCPSRGYYNTGVAQGRVVRRWLIVFSGSAAGGRTRAGELPGSCPWAARDAALRLIAGLLTFMSVRRTDPATPFDRGVEQCGVGDVLRTPRGGRCEIAICALEQRMEMSGASRLPGERPGMLWNAPENRAGRGVFAGAQKARSVRVQLLRESTA